MTARLPAVSVAALLVLAASGCRSAKTGALPLALAVLVATAPAPVAEAVGFETVNGRRCFRIIGVERWRYPSGKETGVRAITLWIDAETYLIQKMVEDTPKGMPRGSISRRITTIKHQANPELEPAQFRFAVPAS